MKRFAAVLVVCSCLSSYAAGGFTVSGGMAKALGEGSENVNLGFNVGGSCYGLVSPSIGLGGEFRFNRWTFDVSFVDASLQYYEFLFTPVFMAQQRGDLQFILQPGIGYFEGVATSIHMVLHMVGAHTVI